MEDSFSVRVDKIFGHLDCSGGGGTRNKSSSADATSPSLWRLSDEEVERRRWNHRKQVEEDDNELCPSKFGDPLKSDLKEEEEEVGEEEDEEEDIDGQKKRRRRRDVKSIIDEDWDVQSNIGRDCTLDYEEEEDEFDKVAVGEEQNGSWDLNLTGYQVDELEPNTYCELPNSFPRDPRTNHVSAEIRLKEGVETSGNTDILPISDNYVAKRTDSKVIARRELDTDYPKPILKKKENLMDSTSRKRVRFSCSPIISSQNELQFAGDTDLPSKCSSGIPDYLRNPSKYTRYTFDSTVNMDDQSNKAYMDVSQQPMKGNNTEYSAADETSADIPKSVTFTPRRKPQVDSTVNRNAKEHRLRNNVKSKGWSIGITAEDTQEHEASAMEEDEPCALDDQGCSFQKPNRQYRARNRVNFDCNST